MTTPLYIGERISDKAKTSMVKTQKTVLDVSHKINNEDAVYRVLYEVLCAEKVYRELMRQITSETLMVCRDQQQIDGID